MSAVYAGSPHTHVSRMLVAGMAREVEDPAYSRTSVWCNTRCVEYTHVNRLIVERLAREV